MWALVRANRIQTASLAAAALAIAGLLGYGIGGWAPRLLFGAAGFHAETGLIGLEIAVLVWIIVTIAVWVQGDHLILAAAGARPLRKKDHPQFWNVVDEMRIAAGLEHMPQPWLVEERAMNAFATGMHPQTAGVAMTAGALARLDRDQLQGLVAHEIAKIANGDVLFLSLVSLMTGAVFARRTGRGALGRNPRYRARATQVTLSQRTARWACGSLALLAPVYAVLIAAGVVRRRVYLADACAALYTRYPKGLADALHILSGDPYSLVQANRGLATLCTVNPYWKEEGIWTPFLLRATHPPADRRVRILRRLHGAVSPGAYERAWQAETGARRRLFPKAAQGRVRAVPVRAPEAAAESPSARADARGAGDLVRRMHGFLFLACACGLRVKLPPEYPHDHVDCPRCGRQVAAPVARLAAAVTIAGAAGPSTRTREPLLEVARGDPRAWMTFRCACGSLNQVSPGFGARFHTCPACGAKIHIRRKTPVQ